MKRFVPMILMLLSACGSKNAPESKLLEAPSNLSTEIKDGPAILLSWQDNCSTESGYYVFDQRVAGKPLATLPANSTSYLVEGVKEGSTYRLGVQAYGSNNLLSKLVVSEPVTIPVAEPEPEPEPEDDALVFHWTEVTGLDLPGAIKLYKTADPVEGTPFNAWYAVADCSASSGVQLRVMYPGGGKTATLDAQAEAASDCLVLVNGGIFGTAPIGFAIMDGVQTPWRYIESDGWAVDKQYWGAVPNSAYERLHPVSRGLFGVDAKGVPGVYWSYTPSHGTVYVYDQPIPTVAGEEVKPEGSTTYPCKPASWVPYNAITCGPVLLQSGKCPITAEKTAGGHWKTNYELWADDIFGVDSYADRTAVGYLPDGRVVLLVCDGRISASKGVTTLQLARIMKGLGCEGALNLDGGGSTGIWVRGGGHLNDLTGGNRPLMTTIGFFSK